MDAFFASCEQYSRPTLRGRPVLVGGVGGRGVVAGCSYEARARGARSAMPMHQARRLVGPSAVVLPPRMVVYKELSRRVFEVFRTLVPVVEQVSVDEAFLEPDALRGATVEQTRQWAEDLRTAVRRATGLPCSVGAGVGKQYAKIASGLAKPDGVCVIARRDHPEVLDPLSVRSLWGVGPVAGERLAQFGVTTIGQLAAMADDDVVQALGRTVGPSIALIARGYDDRPVHERAEAKQISAESTYATDLTTSDQVREAVRRAAEGAHRRLLRDGRAARTVTVKVKRSDFTSITRSSTLIAGTTSLETIVAAATRLAPDPVDFGSVRLLGVGLSGLTEIVQDALFDDEFVSAPESGNGQDVTELPDTVGVGMRVSSGSVPDVADAPDMADADDMAGDGAHDMADADNMADAGDDRAGDDQSPGSSPPGPGTSPAMSPPPIPPPDPAPAPIGAWRTVRIGRFPTGADVRHPDHGHGWVQGSGHGRVSVRFETATTGPGRMMTFREDDADLTPADPVDSLG